MAETKKKGKQKAARAKPKSSGKAKSKTAAKAKSKVSSRAKSTSREKAPAPAGETAKPQDVMALGPGANAALAGQAALAGTKAAGQAVGVVVAKARVPIVATGGLVAGIAGGLAVLRRRNGHQVAADTLDVDRVISAARRAGSFGEELGRLASLMEQASGGRRK